MAGNKGGMIDGGPAILTGSPPLVVPTVFVKVRPRVLKKRRAKSKRVKR